MPSTDSVNSYRNAYLAQTPPDNFDREIWQNLNILSTSIDAGAKEPKVYFSITIPQHYSNHRGTMHGGALATLFDGITGSALNLLRKPGYWDGAQVSRTLRDQVFPTSTIGRDIGCRGRSGACGKKPCNHQGSYRECEGWRIISSLPA